MKLLILLALTSVITTFTKAQDIFSHQNLLPWCIVSFDKAQKTPAQRIAMLKTLGFVRYAYDGRTEHFPTFEVEIDLAHENNIEIEAVWLWINAKRDKTGELSPENEQLLTIIRQKKLRTTLWLSFNDNFFAGLSHHEKVKKGAAFLKFLSSKMRGTGCKIALYNHTGWFGEPENQIEIIKSSGVKQVEMVYNFHHGHQHINRFHALLKTMMPYLKVVNLNGMGESKIMTVGTGEFEKEMITLLKDSGFRGRVGILGHVAEQDAEEVLKANLEGLRKLGF
jgi:hypothetical protein